MKNLIRYFLVLCTVAFAACGSGGEDAGTIPWGDPDDGGGATTGAADLVLTLSATQIPNTGSSTLGITVTAIDASRNTMTSVPVAVTADSDAIVTAAATTTDASGNVAATLSIGANRSNRVITITATSGTISKAATVQVVGTTISSTLVPAVIAPGSDGEVQYRVVDQAGAPMVGQSVEITATGLNPATATGTTGANGDFIFSYKAPTATGAYRVAATIGGASDLQTVTVQTTSTVPNVTTPIVSASLSANPSVVAVNVPGSSSNRSEVRALFVGANNAPIPNVRVRFDLASDPNSIGGTFTAGSRTQTLYSDSSGVVTTAYVPGTLGSPPDGVIVRACYGTSDTDPNLTNCTTNTSQTLTVTSQPLNVTIGTNALVILGPLTYTKQFNVSVVDSAGYAAPDVNLTASVDLPTYRKGFYAVVGTSWVKQGGLPSRDEAVCTNEDLNRNGVLEAGEDGNGNGALEPRKADVRVRLLSNKTDAGGSAVLEVTYDQDHGSWVDAVITVAASGISGSEGRAVYVLAPVPVDAASIKNKDVPPAYVVSPYGTAASCTDPN